MAAVNPLAYTSTGVKYAADVMLAVDSFRWVSSTTSAANDACIVKDAAGNVLYHAVAQGADFIDVMRRHHVPMMNGLNVDTLANGTLYVYLK